jgi:hypothetical protein
VCVCVCVCVYIYIYIYIQTYIYIYIYIYMNIHVLYAWLRGCYLPDCMAEYMYIIVYIIFLLARWGELLKALYTHIQRQYSYFCTSTESKLMIWLRAAASSSTQYTHIQHQYSSFCTPVKQVNWAHLPDCAPRRAPHIPHIFLLLLPPPPHINTYMRP